MASNKLMYEPEGDPLMTATHGPVSADVARGDVVP